MRKKKNRIIVALLFVLIFISSCAEKEIKGPEEITEVEKEETQTDISGDISDVDTLEQDLDMSELENLEKDLDEIDWE